MSPDDEHWLILGASPDLRTQLAASPPLWPRDGRTPIVAVALPNGDVDAWVGLLSLREWSGFEIWATSRVRADLVERNAALKTLEREPGLVRWRDLEPGEPVAFASSALSVEAVPVPGVAPLHLRGIRPTDPLDNVGFVIRDRRGGTRVGWFPCVGAPSAELRHAVANVDVLFFDGTFWSNEELERAGRGRGRAQDIGHWPVGGPEGSQAFLQGLAAREKWLVHVNNTNPVLAEDGIERAGLRAAGVDVAFDGLELYA